MTETLQLPPEQMMPPATEHAGQMPPAIEHAGQMPPESIQPTEAMTWPDRSQAEQIIGADLADNIPFDRFRMSHDETEAGVVDVYEDNPQEFTEPLAPRQQEYVRNQAIDKMQFEAARNVWWTRIPASLKKYGFSEAEAASASKIRAVHSVGIEQDGTPKGRVDIYECGESPESELKDTERQAIVTALEIIDQFSGGTFMAGKGANKILTVSNEGMGPDVDHFIGSTNQDFTMVNIGDIREYAAQKGVDSETLVAMTVAHEILGHKMEQLGEGRDGAYFSAHFDYSEDMKQSDKYGQLHAAVTPKDPSAAGSLPVREYGYSDAAEDLATTAENLYLNATDKSFIEKGVLDDSRSDAYREDLMMRLFDKIAAELHAEGIGYGYVGSPVSYADGPEGPKLVRGRELKVSSLSSADALHRELDSFTEKYKNRTIPYRVTTWPVRTTSSL
jgi:hypothetical protein